MGFSRVGWLTVFLLTAVAFAGCSETRADEKAELRKAATVYFEAEKAGDHAKVWEMLAPSSNFKKKHSYASYVEMAGRNRVRVKSFTIEEVIGVEDNPDKAKMPRVEKVGMVMVHVILTDDDGADSERTTIFTFLKEGGRWY